MQVVICEEIEKCLVKSINEFTCGQYSVQVLKLGVKSLQELFDESKLAEGCVVVLGVYSEVMAQECVRMMKALRMCRADVRFIVCIAALRCLDTIFEVEPDYMFSLPINTRSLRKAVDSCFEDYADRCKSYVTVQRKGKINCLDAGKIIFVESRGRCLEIALQQGEKVTIYMQLKEMQDLLPDYFLRCHQSYCINLKKVEAYDCGKILMHNQKVIPVSKRYRHEVVQILEKSVQK